jgi:hypothetical protein
MRFGPIYSVKKNKGARWPPLKSLEDGGRQRPGYLWAMTGIPTSSFSLTFTFSTSPAVM